MSSLDHSDGDCQILSAESGLGVGEGLAPSGEQRLLAARVALAERREAGHPVGAEVTVIHPLLAPRDENASVLEAPERDRPHRAQ